MMDNLTETASERRCRAAWTSTDERNAAINDLVQQLLIHLPGLSAATQALTLTGSNQKDPTPDAS